MANGKQCGGTRQMAENVTRMRLETRGGRSGGREPVGNVALPGHSRAPLGKPRAYSLPWVGCLMVAIVLGNATIARAADAPPIDRLAAGLRELSPRVLPEAQQKQAPSMVRRDLDRRLNQANLRSSETWRAVKTLRQWEQFRDARLAALRASLGDYPKPPGKLDARVTGKIAGDGYRIRNMVVQSRPGLWITANLYLPAQSGTAMPGILICHSHHRPKEQGELQDMGMTWARAGCAVLVMDQIGHGERRQHPFRTAKDFGRPFRASRQDYYFRYDAGIQLHLAGQSLMGQMV